MSPLLGIYASQRSAVSPLEGSVYEIAKYVVPSGATAAEVVFPVPSGYRHLQIQAVHRCTQVAGGSDVLIRFNGDTSASYSYHLLQGSGSSTTTTNGSSQTYIRNQGTVDGSYTYSFQANIIDVLDYASSTKNKTLRALTGFDANGDSVIRQLSGAWYNFNPITSISFTASGTTFSQFSTFTLLGIK